MTEFDKHYSDKPNAGFEAFSQMVQERIGICLSENKRQMIETRLRRRVRELGLRNTQEYFQHLFEGDALSGEIEIIQETITTNKTEFFREKSHYEYFADSVLKRQAPNRVAPTKQRYKVWSAAAANGAEAYSAAMVLADHALENPDFDWLVLGTDISGRIIREAQDGIYSDEMVRPVPTTYRHRYLRKGAGDWSGKWRVAPNIRQRVRFEKLNLMDENYRVERNLDAIFLRNVLIYFNAHDQLKVLSRIVHHLAPGGHLFVGHAESMLVRLPCLRHVAPAIYRKETLK